MRKRKSPMKVMIWLSLFCMLIFLASPVQLLFDSTSVYAATTPQSENFESVTTGMATSSPQNINDWTFSMVSTNGGTPRTQIKNLAPNTTNDLYFLGTFQAAANEYGRVQSRTGAFKLDSFQVIERNSTADNYRIVGYLEGNPVVGAEKLFSPPSATFYTVDVSNDLAWENIDEFRIYANTTIKMEIDDLTVADPVVAPQNTAPTDVSLSNSSVVENSSLEATIGTLSTTDLDAGDTHTYSFVPGGDEDNFTIDGNQLKTNGVFDFESKNSYSITVRATDSGGATTDQAFTISVTNVNEAPIALSLSANAVSENKALGTPIGTLSTTDPDGGDTQIYSIVSGDVGSFTITGNQLNTNGVFDFETKSSYSIKIRATDSGGLYLEKDFTISATNVNEDPTALSLSANTVSENVASGTAVGILSTLDPDAGDTHTYSIVSGDVGNFSISDNQLKTISVFDFETKDSYSIRIRVTDSGMLTYEKDFTISVTDVNEAPALNSTIVNLTGTNEDTESSEVVVTSFLDSIDQDSGALKGIAINSFNGNGVWQYFDSTWKPIPAVSSNSALLLRDTDKFKYIPDLENGETATLTFHGWDQTTGSPYGTVDVTTNGGTTAFSSSEGTASLLVTSINDAPSITSGVYTFNTVAKNTESTEVTIAAIANMSDVDNPAASGIAIYNTTGNGIWEYFNGLTWQPFGTVSETSSLLLRATDKVRYQSSHLGETASFSFRGWDQSSGTPGTTVDTTTNGGTTTFSANTQTASIEVLKSSEANLLSFSIPEHVKAATINDGTIYVEVAGTQDISNLVPTFTASDFVQSIKVGVLMQTSGSSANDFSNPVTYVVTAEDGTTKNWVVTVNRVPKDITLSNNTVDEKVAAGIEVGILSGVDQDSGAILSYAIQSNDTNVFEIDNNRLITKSVLDYNVKNQYELTIRVTDQHGALYDKAFIINVLDKTPPTANVTMTSNNGQDLTKAKIGDTIILSVITNEDIAEPTINIAGNKGTVSDKGDSDAKTWEATYVMQTGDAEGVIPFTLDFKDVNNNTATQVTAVTTGTAITFDKTAPSALTVTIGSSNTDPTKAKIGDTVTLEIVTSEDVQAPLVTITGKAATVSDNGDGDSKTWQATYVMTNEDSNGNVGFTLNFKDLVGNEATEVTGTTDASSVAFDGSIPTATTVTMSSNNANPDIAKVGDTITLEIATSEDVQSPTVTIAGKAAEISDKGDGDAKTWQATYTLQSGDPEGPVSFTLDFLDLVGNAGTRVTTVTSGTMVIFDATIPTIATVTMTSSNVNDPAFAKVDDTVNLTIVASEDIQSPTVTIAGINATVSDNGDSDAKTWTASYMMQDNDPEGAIRFTLDFQDLVQNTGTQVTSVTSGPAVMFDKTVPTATTVTIASNNDDTTKAKAGDKITLGITTNENVQVPTVTILGNPATVASNGSPTSWSAEYTIQDDDSGGLIEFTIDIVDLAGNNGIGATATTDGSVVTLLSSNKNLSKLTLSNGMLEPTFDPNETSYTVNVVYDVAAVDVTSTVSDAAATVKVNGATIVSGEAVNVPLEIGLNSITVVVTAQDNSTKTYTILITRLSSNNADLSNLIVSEGLLSPDFNPNIGNYSTNVDTSVSELTITAIPKQTEATVVINGNVTTSDTIALNFGLNSVPVKVTAQDGITTRNYVVTINRLKSGNADLETLTVNKGTLTPAFSPSVDAYQVSVDYNTTQISVAAQVADAGSALTLNGRTVSPALDFTTADSISIVTTGDTIRVSMTETFELQVGSNSIPVTVTAQDGGTKIYSLTVIRAAASRDDDDSEDEGNNGPSTPSQSTKEEIKVPVDDGNNPVSETPIIRTTDSNGTRDQVTFTPESAKEAADKLKEQGKDTARIVVPDEKDEVSEVKVDVPKDAISYLNEGKVNLEIVTENVRISVPTTSLVDFNQDLYFRVVPIKEGEQRKEVEERAKKEEIVQEVAQDKTVKVYGRPMTIETNMQSRPVNLVLPLKDTLPANPQERENLLGNLVIFIEHSDGTKELIKGTVTTFEDGTLGMSFKVDKFSTFTMVYMENWRAFFAEQEAQKQQTEGHKAYIAGYTDGTFKPSNNISRAEMAALLSRVYTGEQKEKEISSFHDVSAEHWAISSIEQAQLIGLMKGYSDGTFGPNKSITRAEMAAIVSRWLQLAGEGHSISKDIKGHWAKRAIKLVDEADIMNGLPDGTFQPNKPLTRAETVAIINRILKRGPLNGIEQPTWKDVLPTHWAYKDIEEASKEHKYKIDESGNENYQINQQ